MGLANCSLIQVVKAGSAYGLLDFSFYLYHLPARWLCRSDGLNRQLNPEAQR